MSDYRENDEYDTPRGGGGRHHQQVGRRRDNDDNEAQAPHGRFEGSYSGGHQQHGYQRRHENEYDAPETEAEEYGTGTQSRRHEGGGGGGRRHEYDQRYQDTASHSQYDANSAGRYQQQSQDQEHGGDNRYESESFQSRPQNPYPAAHQSRPSYHQQQQQQQYSASPYPEPSNDSSYGDAGDYDAESTGRPQNPYPAVKPQYHQQSQHSSAAPYPASGRYDSDVPSGLQNPYPPAHGQGHQQQGQHHGESHVQSHPAGTGAHKPSAYANLPVHESAPDNQKQYYSNMQGSRKALLIGINYTGTSAELKGCHNDANNLAQFIQSESRTRRGARWLTPLCSATGNFGYDRNNIRILLDDENARRDTLPTKQNILNAMAWLVKGASPGDALFFHYSGHGSQVESHAGDEIDSMAETICPLDYESAGQINDDEMHRLLVAPLPKGCRLTAIMDCCHSGSSLDLPFCYDTSGQIKGPE